MSDGLKCLNWCICICFVVKTIVIAIILCVSMTWHYHDKTTDSDSMKDYTLTDKVIESTGNYHFCQGLTATSASQPSDPSNATLYLLSSCPVPSLIERLFSAVAATFDFDLSDNNDKSYTWKYNLNTGSVVSLYVCYDDPLSFSEDIEFYLIAGQANHNNWVKNSGCSCVVDHQVLDSDCQTLKYHINESALYFFSFLGDEFADATLYIDFDINRTVYHMPPDGIVHECSFPLDGTSECSVDIPMSSGYTALLSLNTTVPVDYSDSANIKMHCQPRVWFYVVIVFVSILPIVALIGVCICLKVRSKKKQKYSRVQGSQTINTTRSSRTNDRRRGSSKKSKPHASSVTFKYIFISYGATNVQFEV